MSEAEVLLVGLGVALILIALMVEVEHRVIWNSHKDNYHKHKNPTLDKLFRPNKLVYQINIFFVWPLVMALGVWIILQNA